MNSYKYDYKFMKSTEEELNTIKQVFPTITVNEDNIFIFPIVLCDNQVDDDYEAFTNESLTKLAKLFVGKTGIFDNSNVSARIYSYRTFTDIYRLVFKEIEKAINNGKFSTVIDLNEVFIPCELYGYNIANIIYNLKTELTNLGYKFKLIPNTRFDRPEFNIEVNWSNADTTLEEIKSELGRGNR